VRAGENWTLAGAVQNSGILKTNAPLCSTGLAVRRQRRGSSFAWL